MSITESTKTQTAPYGWYPDPAGSSRLRLWSGSAWTNQLATEASGVQPIFGYSEDGRVTRQFTY